VSGLAANLPSIPAEAQLEFNPDTVPAVSAIAAEIQCSDGASLACHDK